MKAFWKGRFQDRIMIITGSARGVGAKAGKQAASILLLASGGAAHMTDAILQTDGGWACF